MAKINQKGFTLIELMVVISIIGLLSSIVLASLNGARQKAILNKATSEMKSLQTAVELYKNQMGVYPGESLNSNYDDDVNCVYLCGLYMTGGSMQSFFTTELVNRKLMSSVPHAPYYPNNCGADCATNGYILGYSVTEGSFYGDLHKNNTSPDDYFVCGADRVKNYIIYLATNNKKLNLPILGMYSLGSYYTVADVYGTPQVNIYCLSM